MRMRRIVFALLASAGVLALVEIAPVVTHPIASARPAAAQGAIPGGGRFIGTWKLINVERRNAKGEVIAPAPATSAALNRTGYLVYDPAGYMAVSIMPVGRTKYAGAQPTNEEALAAITGYSAYFGTFSVDQAGQVVTHHLHGSLNPGMAAEQRRGFEFSGNRLTLKPPAAANGDQSRLTWERMPDLPEATAEHRRFHGFWKLVSNERRTEVGELVSSNTSQSGYIIYTPAGFMMVHMMQPGRKPYAGPQPTPEEARQTLRTYTNYFGPFYLHDADGYVVHDQVGTLNVGRNGPSPQQRFYQISGNRLMLRPPPTYTAGGPTSQATITWERVEAVRSTQP